MDEGRFSEAIYLMEYKLKSRPEDLKARKLLAAAYAGRAGVYLKEFIDFSELIIKSFKESEIKPEPERFSLADSLYLQVRNSENTELNEILKHLSQWLNALRKLEEVVTAFNRVPRVDTSIEAADIENAVLTLKGEDSPQLKLPPDLSLYRGLLRLTLLNYHLRHTFAWSNPGNCDVSMEELINQAGTIFDEVKEVLLDIADSSISKKSQDRLREMAQNLSKQFEKFKENTSSLESQLTIALVDDEVKKQQGCQ